MSIYEAIKNMSKEELAEWLYANCAYLETEYCCGDSSFYIRRLLDREIGEDW